MPQNVPQETIIDGKKYVMYMLPPMQSQDLLFDVLKMVGPSCGPILDVLISNRSGSKIDVSTFLEQEFSPNFFTLAAKEFFGGLNKDIVRLIEKSFADVTQVDGMPLNKIFDIHFLGDIGGLFRWVTWGMGVQWGKVFSALVKGASGQGAEKERASVSQSPSI